MAWRPKPIFDNSTTIVGRSPSHGYRALHVIVRVDGKSIELQVRSELQHLWAELSEKLSDIIHPGLKYGRGPEDIQSILINLGKHIAGVERNEIRYAKLRYRGFDPGRMRRIRERLNRDRRYAIGVMGAVIDLFGKMTWDPALGMFR